MIVYTFIYDAFSHIPSSALIAVCWAAIAVAGAVLAIFKKRAVFFAVCSCANLIMLAHFLSVYPTSAALFFSLVNIFVNFFFIFLERINIKKKKVNAVEEFTKQFLSPKEEEKGMKIEQRKILCSTDSIAQEGEEYSLKDENVSLNHAIGVALQLKKARLSVGDRLETDGIYRTLNLYRAKNFLSAEETNILNAHLSTLLKLMAKYSL